MAVVQVTKEIRERDLASIDWNKVDAKTDAEIEAAVASDPDAAPLLTEAQLVAGRIRVIRKRTGLTQAEFAGRYGIPPEALRAWEEGSAQPDLTARSYLRAIGNQPEAVAEAVAAE